ncbi:MAG: nitrate/nitrite transporter, partial [Veillonella sp.]|nr:nitrate/nitrite transporter [Veillonella sp.]
HVFGNPLLSSLITGFVAAVAAYGAFITPKIFGFVYSTFGNIHPAFAVLLAFNIVTVAVCFWFYVRKGANMNV